MSTTIDQQTIKAADLIAKNGGKIFGVTFTKKDGTERKMTARCGVAKHVTGKGMSFDPKIRGLQPVFDLDKGDYRMVNLKTVKELRMGGKVINFERTISA